MAENVGYLKTKAREWASKVVNLSQTNVPPSMQAEKKRLLSFAKKIKTTLEKIFGTFDEFKPIEQELGAFPVIIGGIVFLGAGAAITKWTLDYKKFMAKIVEQRRLEADGVPPAQAARIIKTTFGDQSIFSNMAGSITPYLIVGGIAYFLWRKR